MKNQIYSIFTLLLFCLITANLQAQSTYKSAVGGRLGYPLAVSFKQFINDSHAFEAYVGTRGYGGYRWTNVSLAYQVHHPIDGVEGLQYYFGGGGSVYFWNFNNLFLDNSFNSTTFGIQFYGGLDYKFEDLPLNISIDWIPSYLFNSYNSGFSGTLGSIGVRYVLK